MSIIKHVESLRSLTKTCRHGSGVKNFDNDSLTLLVPYFDSMLISEFRDAVSNTATGDCILTRLLDASSVGVLGL